jgi:hypothetical protein
MRVTLKIGIAAMKRSVASLLVLLPISLTALSGAPILLAANSAQSTPAVAARVRGVWTVTKVSTDPSAKVAALLDNDPAYFGAMVTFTGDAITWDSSKTNGKGTYDTCKNPHYSISSDTPGFYAIKCSNDSSGFDTTIKSVNHDTLIMNWYDGGILTLMRKSFGT